MSVHGKYNTVTVAAGADLSAVQYKAVTLAGVIAAESDTAGGILMNKPENGEHATLATDGNMKGSAGTALTAGTRVKVTTSGWLIAVASGDGTAVGKVVTAAASGATVNFIGDFANANTVFNQT